MAARILAERKQKSVDENDSAPNERFTGMSPATVRHFLRVQEKMKQFVSQKELWGSDPVQEYLPEDNRRRLQNPFVDGKKVHVHSQIATPVLSKKSNNKNQISTPQLSRQRRQHRLISNSK